MAWSEPRLMSWQALLSGIRHARRSMDKFEALEARKPQLGAYARREKARFALRLEALELEWRSRAGRTP